MFPTFERLRAEGGVPVRVPRRGRKAFEAWQQEMAGIAAADGRLFSCEPWPCATRLYAAQLLPDSLETWREYLEIRECPERDRLRALVPPDWVFPTIDELADPGGPVVHMADPWDVWHVARGDWLIEIYQQARERRLRLRYADDATCYEHRFVIAWLEPLEIAASRLEPDARFRMASPDLSEVR